MSHQELDKDKEGRKRITQPEERTEPGKHVTPNPEDRKHDKHSCAKEQCTSWRQMISGFMGRERNQCKRPALLDGSLTPLQVSETTDRAMCKTIRKII